jgi:uncharacterized cupredoxin-like copper-binding protein
LALLLVGGLAAACGSDDDGTDKAAGDTTTTSADGTAAEPSAFCSGYIELTAGQPDPGTIRDLAAKAPEAAKAPMEALAAGVEKSGEAFSDTDEFRQNFAAMGKAAADECADDTLEVSAIDYAFEGMPAEVDAGMVAVDLTNKGKEMHEMVVFRKNDDAGKSFDEIFGMDEADAQKLLTTKGATFAAPGESSTALLDLSEPGDYIALCFIPVGSTPDHPEAAGPPHFTKGMKMPFTVS